MASPTAHASTVAPMSAMNRPLPASSNARHSTEEVSGSARRLMMPSRPAASASSKNDNPGGAARRPTADRRRRKIRRLAISSKCNGSHLV